VVIREPAVSPPSIPVAPSRRLAEANICVVTPLFGGGAEAGEVDPAQPVRGGSVRGHLRF